MRLRASLLPLVTAVVLSFSPDLSAATIVDVNVGTNPNGDTIVGQSVTILGGGPWDNISFNFFEPDDDPFAVGTLFILDAEYLGIPANLTSSTPGYLADTSVISGGTWLFPSGFTLQPLTTYYFYATTPLAGGTITGSLLNPYSGGVAYAVVISGGNYVSIDEADFDFRLSGESVLDAPEPTSVTILGLGLAAITVRRWRQRRAT